LASADKSSSKFGADRENENRQRGVTVAQRISERRPRMKWQTGASRIVEALQQSGVRCVFGLPGTQTIDLFEALRVAGLRTVIATNELSAAFMAGGWSRVTGEPGILITISGPGFTWALTGVAEARLDSVALLHIAGAPATDTVERSFRQQELPEAEMAAPLVKGIIDAGSYADPGEAVAEALLLARSGEPGPVLLQVTSTTLSRDLDGAVVPSGANGKSELDDLSLPAARNGVDAVSLRIRHTRRPIFMVGQGTNRYAAQLRALVERLQVPLITTPSARGVLPENHPLSFGFDPMAGNVQQLNAFLESADVVVAIGCKLGHSDTSGFSLQLPAERLIHVDASTEVIEANYPASLGVVGDAGELFKLLLDSPPQRSAWTEKELEGWRARLAPGRSDAAEPRIGGTPDGNASSFFKAVRRALPDDSILVLDSGLHQILARRYYSVLAPYGLIMPTDLQSMGFAIPTAIGARLAVPSRPVVALVGDGGFAMRALELLTAVREGVSLVVIVFADGAFGQIRMQQLASYGASHGVALQNPDFNLLALSVGARHESVGPSGDIERCVRSALSEPGVTVVEVRVRDAFPMRGVAASARARRVARRAAGPPLFKFLRGLFRKS
jgi:acetolactate synthase-1/2/3 large subunit